MQYRAKEVDDYSLLMKSDDSHTRVYANMTFSEGAEIGRATSLWFSSTTSLKAFLQSDARPNHRRFADRLVKLDDIIYNGSPSTFYGVLVGIAGEIMAPSQGQRANVELVLAPAQGFNPGLVKLVVKTRNKQGLSKGAELLLDYGDEFDVKLPLLTSGAPVPMLGPMDLYMQPRGSEGEPAAKRRRKVPPGGSEDNVDKVTALLHQVEEELEKEIDEDNAALVQAEVGPSLAPSQDDKEAGQAEEEGQGPFSDMKKFGPGDRLERTHVRCDLCFQIRKYIKCSLV